MDRGQKGFTLLELAVVVSVVALIGGLGLERLWAAQEGAERMAVEYNLIALKNALRIRTAELITANRWEELSVLSAKNPFDLLEEVPPNYAGPWREDAEPGKWYYDAAARAVRYRVRHGQDFRDAAGARDMEFAVVGLDSEGRKKSRGVTSVTFRAAGDYRWQGRVIR